MGSGDEAIPLIEQAIRLSPGDPISSTRYGMIGFVHLPQSRTNVEQLHAPRGDIAVHGGRCHDGAGSGS